MAAKLPHSHADTKVVRGDRGSFPLQGVPHHQFGGGITYSNEIDGFGKFAANVNATCRSRAPLDAYDVVGIQKGYARVGADRIGGSQFGAAVFISNLTKACYEQGGAYLLRDCRVLNGVSPGGGPGSAASAFGQPRMYDVEASVSSNSMINTLLPSGKNRTATCAFVR